MTAKVRIKSYSLKYPGVAAIWLDLCERHLLARIMKCSMLDKRFPVTATECSDCVAGTRKGTR